MKRRKMNGGKRTKVNGGRILGFKNPNFLVRDE